MTNVQFAADRSVNVLSKRALVEYGNAAIHQYDQRIGE